MTKGTDMTKAEDLHVRVVREVLSAMRRARQPDVYGSRYADSMNEDIAREVAKDILAAQADAQGRCARCGSSGDTYVLCSGCGAPTSSDAQGGEVVAWMTKSGASTTDPQMARIWRDTYGFAITPLCIAPTPFRRTTESGNG